MQKRFFALLLALCMGSGTAYAYSFSETISGKTFYFNITNSTQHYVEITYPGTSIYGPWDGYTKPTGSITLPSTVTNNNVTYTVKAIGDYAFYECSGLTGTLTIPNTVTTIGDDAFNGCSGFTGSLTIPNSVTSIGQYAFYHCTGFNGSLLIGNYVTTIGSGAFEECTGFTGSLSLGIRVTSLGASAFKNCSGFTQVRYNPINCANVPSTDKPFEGCSGTLVIGNTVQRIPNYMFFGCSGFTGSLTIPDSVTEIGTGAFRNCTGFNGSLTLGNSLTTIGVDAFCNCNGFTGDITIPNSVTTINNYAFYYCTSFNGTLTIPSYVTTIGTGAFSHCTSITQVNYNATNCADVTSSAKPFASCGGSLTIGNDVQRIPSYMFNEGTSFTGSLTIGTGVTSIGTKSFYNCTGFTQVYFNAINCGDAVYLSHPFENCGGHLNIGSYVTRIPESIFPYADFTGSLSIPSSVTSIGYEAFYSCFHFSGSLTLGSSLTTIGTYAFYQCPGFTGTLTIPNSVTTLDIYAFALCSGFTSVTIGSNVNTINYGAFYDCNGLNSMTVRPETPPALDNNVFYEVSKDIPVYVPCSSLDDYQSAEGWSDFTNYQCNPTVTVTVVPTAGGTVTGGGTYTTNATVTVTATPNDNYVFMHWTKNGTVISCNPSYTFSVQGDTEFEAVFVAQSSLGDIIGEGMAVINNQYLPSFSYYKYSLTEQIYTSTEMGGSRTITSISFFNAGATKTRTYDIYMKHTTKTEFSSTTDWVSVTSSYKVFSGSVTMRAGMWTTIVLDTPFSYNGSSNLLLVVDDNSGSYTNSPHMECHSYASSGNQTLRICSDGTNYNPSGPSSYTGTLMSEKNHIMLNRTAYNINATSGNTTAGTVSGGGTYGQGDLCTLQATAKTGYTFVSWVNESGVVVSTDANYSFLVTENKTLVAHFMSGTDFCSLTFDLFDSYGDGWNGNQLVVNYANGMTEKLTVPSSAHDATFTLPVPSGSHVELSWIEGGYVHECSFVVSYTDGKVIYVGTDLDANFTYEFDMDCSGQPSELVYLGNHSMANNYFLPSHSFYNYSLSEQIYTADEIGEAGLINCIAFYNAGAETRTRTYHIYLATTNKTAFSSPTDWISTSNATLVYNGSVTMYAGRWTPILFSTAFDYDGVSNLVLIVDDNTGSYTSSPYMSCLVYPTSACQALRIYSDGTNYDPSSPSSYTGTLQNVKNQIMLNIASCEEPLDLTVTNITTSSANIDWTSDHYSFELQYRQMGPDNDFENGIGLWTTIDADGDGYCWFVDNNDFGHDGTRSSAHSESYFSGSALDPDNYLVSPQVTLGGSITFWASAYSSSWSAEHFGVAVSTTNGTNASAFTTIQEWTMTAKGDGAKTGHTRDGGDRAQGSWYQYTVDLSAYAGQTGYVAIRHFNCSNQWRLIVDDITVMQPGVNSLWTTNEHAASPYALTGLMHGTQYEVRVRSNCVGSHYSDWGYTAFTTLDCEAKSLPYTCGFENENEFSCWSMVNCHNNTGISTDAGHASPHGFSFYYTYTPPQYLISPELTGTGNGVLVEFDYKNRDSDYPETFQVGYSTTDDDIDSFVWESEVTISDEQWSLYSTTFPAGTKYVAVRCNSDDQLYLYLDDFSFTVPDITQTIELVEGWNWVSTYIDMNAVDGMAMLLEGLGDHATQIVTYDDSAEYFDGVWYWGSGEENKQLTNSEMIMIEVVDDCTVTLEGPVVGEVEITINPEWNWIGYPIDTELDFTEAMSAFNAEDEDSFNGFGATNDYFGEWYNTFETLVPGQGYMYFSNSNEPKTLVFQTGAPAHAYVDLGLPSGLLWATCNLGATSPEDYGDYFAWGETTPKSDYSWSTYQYCMGSNTTFTKYCNNSSYGYNGFTDNLTTLLPEDDAATANWGSDWRMPTKEEFQELYNNTTVTWTQQNGVNGRLFTAANGNSLFLPAAGYRNGSNLYGAGSGGNCWSSSLITDYPNYAWYFGFDSGNYTMNYYYRYYGFTVRAVRSAE